MGRHKKNGKRANGEGTLERRSDGTYMARVTVNGRRYARATHCTVKAEAKKVLDEFVKNFQDEYDLTALKKLEKKIEGKKGEIAEKEDREPALRLSDAFNAYFDCTNVDDVSEGTKRVYRDMFHRLEKFIGNHRSYKVKEMREFTHQMADAFLSELKKDVRGATYKRYRNFFKMLWQTLNEKARCKENPWEGFNKKHRLDTISRRNLTQEEIRKVIGSVEGEWRILFMMGYYTGMRLVDCVHVKYTSLDFGKHTISVVMQKTKRTRPEPIEIPLAPDLYNLIAETPTEKRNGYLMPTCAQMYDQGTINYRLKKIFEGVGIKTNSEAQKGRKVCEVGFHSLRSGFTTYAINAGIPLPVIQMLVGHGSPRMTAHYFRGVDDNLKQCVGAIPSLFDNATKRETVILNSDTVKLLRSKLTEGESLDDGLKRLLSKSDSPSVTAKPFNSNEFMNKPIVMPIGYKAVS